MEIRRINKDERQLVVELFDQYRVFYKQPSNLAVADAFIKDRLENGESVIFVAFVQEEGRQVPAGFTQLYPTYSSVRVVKNWILNDLYVHQDHRRKGIGEKLIQAAMQFARENGATYVQLETAVDNYTAQSLYETIGFEKQLPDTDYFVYRIGVN